MSPLRACLLCDACFGRRTFNLLLLIAFELKTIKNIYSIEKFKNPP